MFKIAQPLPSVGAGLGGLPVIGGNGINGMMGGMNMGIGQGPSLFN
jgi:hypothetical protein